MSYTCIHNQSCNFFRCTQQLQTAFIYYNLTTKIFILTAVAVLKRLPRLSVLKTRDMTFRQPLASKTLQILDVSFEDDPQIKLPVRLGQLPHLETLSINYKRVYEAQSKRNFAEGVNVSPSSCTTVFQVLVLLQAQPDKAECWRIASHTIVHKSTEWLLTCHFKGDLTREVTCDNKSWLIYSFSWLRVCVVCVQIC